MDGNGKNPVIIVIDDKRCLHLDIEAKETKAPDSSGDAIRGSAAVIREAEGFDEKHPCCQKTLPKIQQFIISIGLYGMPISGIGQLLLEIPLPPCYDQECNHDPSCWCGKNCLKSIGTGLTKLVEEKTNLTPPVRISVPGAQHFSTKH